MIAANIEAAEAFCERYGPGRLPRAEDRTVGAGYAVATAALSAAALFVVVMGGYGVLTTILVGETLRFTTASLALPGLMAIPIIVPAAFLAGALVWRTLPEGTSYYGPVAGVLATALTYVFALPLVAVGVFGYMLLSPDWLVDPAGAAVFTGLVGIVGFVLTCWLTLPLGALGGHVHARAAGPHS
jgi:hypothetical protein